MTATPGPSPLLVATDVDGTLIDDDEQVPPANVAVIAEVVRAGALFVLATGRPPRWLPQVVEQLPVRPVAVCANGAVVVDTAAGEVLATHLLHPAELRELDSVLRERLPGCGIAAERLGEDPIAGGDAADDHFVSCADYRHAWLQPGHLEIGREAVLSRPVIKLLARVPGWTSAQMVEALGGAADRIADVTYSTTNGLIEFSARGVTKAGALDRLAAERGIDPSRVVAFGDMPNDAEMLRWAGRGVAMGNCLESVRAIADEVTLTNNEAGLAHVLRRWFPA